MDNISNPCSFVHHPSYKCILIQYSMYLYIFLFTKPLKSSTLAADFKIEMKNISILYIMKQLLVSIAIVFASILTVTGQNHSFSLSGKWNFQIDREDIGTKEQWFKKSLDDQINLPGSMPEKLKGDEVTARTSKRPYGSINRNSVCRTVFVSLMCMI